MKKLLKVVVALVIAGLVIIQFFRIDKTVPPIKANETLDSAVLVDPDVAEIMGRSCNDCHSNSTIYPWYSNVQPMAWLLKSHIDDGRRHLNLSVFNTYAASKQVKKLDEICEEVESGEMPLPSYLWIHRDASLSDTEKQRLCDWANAVKTHIVVE